VSTVQNEPAPRDSAVRGGTDGHPADLALDDVSGATVLVGEMLEWSDLEHLDAPLAALEVLTPLLESRPGSRVLLAGPRAALLVASVGSAARVDVVTRSLPDARTVGDLAGLRDGVRLHVGGIDAFTGAGRYDAVVALGGPERLLGPDSRGMGAAELLAHLGGLLTPGGLLVADLANELGLDDLVAGRPAPDLDTDAAWHVGADGFDTRHLYPRERRAVLEDAGLREIACYAALPTIDTHRVLVLDRPGAPDDGVDVDGLAVTAAASALDRHLADGPQLREPRPTVARAVGAGLLTELAPAWLVVAVKNADGTAVAKAGVDVGTDAGAREREADGGEPTDIRALPDRAALPVLVDVEPAGRWSVLTVVGADGRRRRRWADGSAADERSEGALVRRLPADDVPPVGPTLEDALRTACASRQHARVRAAVQRYADWLTDEEAWAGRATGRAWAVPADVVDESGSLRPADDSWGLGTPVTADEALVHGLRHFAARLLGSASVHPWRSDTTPDELTVTLASMVGLTVGGADLESAARLDGSVQALVAGTPELVAELADDSLARGRFARDLPVRDATGYRELLAHDRTQARALREKQGQVAWLEGTLRHRDRYIRRLERIIENHEETLTYRTVQALRTPRRVATAKAVSAAKTTANEVLPPDAMSKARQLAARVLR
jgi:hypothetical protein